MDDVHQTPLRVLVVDDSRAIQAIIRRVLQEAGLGPMQIDVASDGEQALRMLEDEIPDLVISDWHMPKVTGIELLQTLRQLRGDEVRIGFVTTETADHHLDQARSNGALFVIHKPFKDDELLKAVQRALADRVEELKKPPQALRSEAVLTALVKQQMGQIPFRLIEAPQQTLQDLKLPHYLGMYAAVGQKTPFALVVLDVNACCILGGGGAKLQPLPVRDAMQHARPTAEMVQFAEQFLKVSATGLAKPAGMAPIELKVANLLGKPFDKLQGLVERNRGRSDYRISVPGYGEGRMVYFKF